MAVEGVSHFGSTDQTVGNPTQITAYALPTPEIWLGESSEPASGGCIIDLH